MAKRLTNKQIYGDGFLHTYLVHIPSDTTAILKKDILFDNFNKNYLNDILNNYNVSKILEIVANKPQIKKIEITLSLLTPQEPKINRVIEQIRLYPQSLELNDIESLFKKIKISDGLYQQKYNHNWKDEKGKPFWVDFVYIGLEHNNASLYKLL
jgi:transposase